MIRWIHSLHKKIPFLNNVISLILGAVISYTIQYFVDALRQSVPPKIKIFSLLVLITSIVVTFLYYKFFSPDIGRKTTFLETEQEKNEIQRLKDERAMVSSLYKQGTKEIEKDDLSIIEKAEIYKKISLVTKDNKRDNNTK